jgi:MFS family permease
MCTAEIFSMTGFSIYPALLPRLRDEWGLSNSTAGLIGGAFFGGYMIAVPLLTALTDRIDTRRVYVLGAALAITGAAGLAGLAQGAASAVVFQALLGAGLAGTYMPGLRILTDRMSGPRQSRYLAVYTAVFGFGTSASLLLAGQLEPHVHWRWIFAAAALGPALAALAVLFAVEPAPERGATAPPSRMLDFGPVLRNPASRVYITGYAVHCWELFGVRSWAVAFLVFSAALQPKDGLWNAATVVAIVNLFGAPASVLGNEIALRWGRERFVRTVMVLSFLAAAAVGAGAGASWTLLLPVMALHVMLVMSDSASLTAGVVASATPTHRGATMGLYSLAGFGAGFVAPLVFGVVLDLAGGATSRLAWGLAFPMLALGGLVWSLGTRRRRRDPGAPPEQDAR